MRIRTALPKRNSSASGTSAACCWKWLPVGSALLGVQKNRILRLFPALRSRRPQRTAGGWRQGRLFSHGASPTARHTAPAKTATRGGLRSQRPTITRPTPAKQKLSVTTSVISVSLSLPDVPPGSAHRRQRRFLAARVAAALGLQALEWYRGPRARFRASLGPPGRTGGTESSRPRPRGTSRRHSARSP